MKKIFTLVAIASCAFATQQVAAQKVVIYNTNGQTIEYSTAEVEKIAFVADENKPNPNDYEYVDLGLPSGTKWAKYNIGSTDPEECGSYFAWGETTPKSEFTLENYKWYDAKTGTYTKYTATDGHPILEAEDDAATVNWGEGWAIPTMEQWIELLTNFVDFEVYVVSPPRMGQNEYTIANKFTYENGNYIILAGQGHIEGTEFNYYHYGNYTTFYMSDNFQVNKEYFKKVEEGQAGVTTFGPFDFNLATICSYCGSNIRPVYNGKQ